MTIKTPTEEMITAAEMKMPQLGRLQIRFLFETMMAVAPPTEAAEVVINRQVGDAVIVETFRGAAAMLYAEASVGSTFPPEPMSYGDIETKELPVYLAQIDFFCRPPTGTADGTHHRLVRPGKNVFSDFAIDEWTDVAWNEISGSWVFRSGSVSSLAAAQDGWRYAGPL